MSCEILGHGGRAVSVLVLAMDDFQDRIAPDVEDFSTSSSSC